MLRFLSFGSGSCGNCYYLEYGADGVIIDAGVGIRAMKRHFLTYGINQGRIKAVFLTHDHADHVSAAASLAACLRVPVYATAAAHKRINENRRIPAKIPPPLARIVEEEVPVFIGGLAVCAFDVPHDSPGCSGYAVTAGGKSFVIITDCGSVTAGIARRVREADFLVLETNYDPDMLRAGRYPDRLKKRIAGAEGHLSNADAAALLAGEKPPRLRQLFLCHLSENNNTPQAAARAVGEALRSYGAETDLHVLARRRPTGFFRLA